MTWDYSQQGVQPRQLADGCRPRCVKREGLFTWQAQVFVEGKDNVMCFPYVTGVDTYYSICFVLKVSANILCLDTPGIMLISFCFKSCFCLTIKAFFSHACVLLYS